ncbi:MAG TPA: ATP-binding protein [Pirellulales bacterium]|nr:ATP-binding protein [Pirellulales bacterium]
MTLTLLLLVANSLLIWKTQRDFGYIAEVEFELQKLRASIVHLDEILTMSCRLSAATGDLQWEQRYREYEPLLDQAIRQAIELTPESNNVDAAAQTDAANVKLVRIENQAFDLVRRGQLKEASALLAGAEYSQQKQIYSDGMQRLAVAIDKTITDGVGRYRLHQVFAVTCTVLGSLVLAVTWFATLRIVHRDNVRRRQAEEALNTAHAQLELRVQDRTKELQESEQRFDSAARGSHDGLWNWDIRSDSEWWSPRFYELLGYDDGEIEASFAQFQDLLHPDDKQRTLAAIASHLDDQVPYDIEYRLRTKSGTYRWFSARGQAIWNDVRAPVRMAGSIRDITDRIAAEQALKQRARELEVANRDLQEFAHITSHDLREPLRAVSGFCSLLAQRYQALLDEQGKEFMQHIVEGASRMSNLLDGVLAYSRVGTHGSSFEQVDCNKVLETALANLHTAIEESHANVEHDNLPTITCDKTQLVQLFQNLIANAVKYRDERNPQIHVSAAKDGDFWQFRVQDNGIGFDSSQSEGIYDIFRRLHTRDEYAGLGLGLAICKRIVQRHGGRIWAESETGVGSTFYFTISERAQGEPTNIIK